MEEQLDQSTISGGPIFRDPLADLTKDGFDFAVMMKRIIIYTAHGPNPAADPTAIKGRALNGRCTRSLHNLMGLSCSVADYDRTGVIGVN